MDRPLLRTLARCRRILLAIYVLPEGTLPPELDDPVEELLMPGYRDRVMAAYLDSPPTGEHLQYTRDCLGGHVPCPGSSSVLNSSGDRTAGPR